MQISIKTKTRAEIEEQKQSKYKDLESRIAALEAELAAYKTKTDTLEASVAALTIETTLIE